jgi:hypothetical protein
VVLVALCLTLVLGVAVAGFVAVCARTMAMSNRSFCYTSSTQLAEIGLEEALWSLNQALQAFNSGSSYDWPGSGWTVSGTTVAKPLTGFATNVGITGTVSLQITNFNPQNLNLNDPSTFPVITSSGTSQMPDGIPITRQLTVRAKPAALFGNAIGAYSSSSFTINWVCQLDSYDTSPPNPVDYSAQTPTDQAIVSAPNVSVNAANVFGYVATAGTAPTYTTGGTVKRADSTVARDPRYILTNANQSFFDILSNANLPGTYAGPLPTGTAELPSGPLSRYTTTDLTLTGSDTLTIRGPVIIVVSGNLSIQDTASIVITDNGSAQIIVSDSTGGSSSIYIGGGGINNTTKLPKNLAVISRNAGSYYWSPEGYYTVKLETSTPFYGVIYAPNGKLSVTGTSTIYGALVANVVDQHYGNGAIHYDLNLRRAVFSALNTPYDISQWIAPN